MKENQWWVWGWVGAGIQMSFQGNLDSLFLKAAFLFLLPIINYYDFSKIVAEITDNRGKHPPSVAPPQPSLSIYPLIYFQRFLVPLLLCHAAGCRPEIRLCWCRRCMLWGAVTYVLHIIPLCVIAVLMCSVGLV